MLSKFKGNYFEFKRYITGTIEFWDKENNNKYNGYIKLKKEPKLEVFSKNNVLVRGTYVGNIGYIIGVVLYAGNDCQKYDIINKSFV